MKKKNDEGESTNLSKETKGECALEGRILRVIMSLSGRPRLDPLYMGNCGSKGVNSLHWRMERHFEFNQIEEP